MPPPRIPKPSDFAHLSPQLTLSFHSPTPPESTTAILVLFHGLGDSDAAFASFARAVDLPGVFAIAVRGVAPVPDLDFLDAPPAAAAASSPSSSSSASASSASTALGAGPRRWHWGDDLALSGSDDDAGRGLDADPGFERAAGLVLDRLIGDTVVGRLGWGRGDVLLFGFGQGGTFALGLASRIAGGGRVEEVVEDGGAGVADDAARGGGARPRPDDDDGRAFKGVVSIGGALPGSMVPADSGGGAGAGRKAPTPVLLCRSAGSAALDAEAVAAVKARFADVRDVVWKAGAGRRRGDDGMPRNREEMLPIMKFFAERLRDGL